MFLVKLRGVVASGWGPVELAVFEHGEQDIDSAPGEADECGVVFLALGSFPVVVGPADGIGSERGER